MKTFINISERYGADCEVTLFDYLELNPCGQFKNTNDGIYEFISDRWEKIAE